MDGVAGRGHCAARPNAQCECSVCSERYRDPYTFERVRGISNMLFGQSGFFIDKFRSHAADGVLWLHGYGNVFEKVLAPGETIDIEPGGWLYKDPDVKMETVVDRLTSGLFGSGFNFTVNRFTGPGRVGIQSMYVNYASDET